MRDCSTLGTVTATGSSLDLSRCKYLRHCDVYNTALTEVQLDTSGGSLVDIYYPKTIQSINLIKQRLLETVGLPYGTKGEEVPTSLYNISIQECPSIKKLNTSSDPEISSSFASMVYCNNLTLRNSLDLATLNFDGFYRLKNVVIENMYNLQTIGFNNLLPAGETSTLKYVGMSNCPKLSTFELNCTSNDYEITLADDAILNLGGLISLKSITSNCVLKGIKTIIVPTGLDSMFFTNTYGSGYSTIKNIWASSQCNVNTGGTTPTVTHVNGGYEGIDFAGMNLKNIDLGALVNIPKAINFTLYPTTVNPHFNLNRDGETYPYLQPVGTLDLSNYTESLAKFFDGVDLDKLKIVCTNKLPQTDLSYCFYNATFSNDTAINTLLSKVSSITNLDYCFYKTTVADTSILSKISMGESSTMNYTFAECPNITTLKNVTIPSTVIEVEGMFYKCPLKAITNMTVNVNGSISGLFKGCTELTTISTLKIPNVTDVSSTFEGCTSLTTLTGFELPSSCTNVSNLFNGCYMLTSMSMNFSSNILAGENWYPPNLETLNDTNIESSYVKLTNCSTLKNVNNLYINNGDYSDMFNGCPNLESLTLTIGTNITGLARFIKDCSKITSKPFTEIPEVCTTIEEMFNGTNITDISGMIFGSKITNATNWLPIGLITANNVTIKNKYVKFDGCSTLVNCNNLTITNNVNDLSYMFNNCTKLANFYLSDSCDLSKVTTTMRMFYLCNALTEIDFKKLDISSMNSMEDFFRGSSNTTIKNFRLTSNSCIYTRAFYYPYYLENIYVGNNNAINAFGKNTMYKSQVKTITGLSFGESVTDISEMFKSCLNLTHDFIIPATITNCSNCFNSCTSMTHIHSNWNNVYDNEITPTDCYAGCTGITHCDGVDLGVGEYVKGLDEVPLAWGGYEFTKAYTGIYRIVTPNDNYEWYGNMGQGSLLGNKIVDWGDGTITTGETKHTYEKAGTYIIKGNIVGNYKNCNWGEPGFYITHIYQMPNGITYNLSAGQNSNLTSLEYANVTGLKFASARGLFANCTKLTRVDGLTTLDMSECVAINYMFCNCSSLTSVDISGWDAPLLRYATAVFYGCSSLETVKMNDIRFGYNFGAGQYGEFGNFFAQCTKLNTVEANNVSFIGKADNIFNNCSSLTNIDGISTWDMSRVYEFTSIFNNCKSLVSLDLSTWDFSNVTNTSSMFQRCTALTSIVGINNWNTAKVTNFAYMFSNCSALTSLDLSNWNLNRATNISYLFNGCTKLSELILPTNVAFGTCGFSGVFQNCSSLTSVDLSTWTGMADSLGHCLNGSSIKTFDFSGLDCQTGNFGYFNPSNSNGGLTEFKFFKSTTFVASGSTPIKPFQNIGWASHPNSTRESLVSILKSLPNTNTDGVNYATTEISFGATNLAKLSEEDILIATNKGWTLT